MTSTVLSMHIGKKQQIQAKNQYWNTGIFKEPVQGPVLAHENGFGEDYIGSLDVHGGPLRALYLYPNDAYKNWKDLVRPELLKPGMFGENLLMSELDETQIFIGDRFQLGETILQATCPRNPCMLFQSKVEFADAIRKFCEFKRPGIYFKVEKRGNISVGDKFQRISRSDNQISMVDFFIDCQEKKFSEERLNIYLAHPLVPDIIKTRMKVAFDAKTQKS